MKTWFAENILMPFGAGIVFAAIMFCGYLVVSEITIPICMHVFNIKTTTETKQALPIEVTRTHEPEYKWVEYQRNRDTIYLYRVPVAVKIVADSTTNGTGKLIIQYSYK